VTVSTEMGAKRATKTDVAVGERIREFRKNAKLSQTQLAEQIGVTFQQVQKYEKGTNRVGASRLTQIAHALDVPITAFFDGLGRPIDKRRVTSARLAKLRAAPGVPKLLAAFSEISDEVLQMEIVNLVRALGSSQARH
jgi:transcriptional regulator with XRE-family HTH domain